MSDSAAAGNALRVTAPCAGTVSPLSVTTSAAVQDMSLCGFVPGVPGYPGGDQPAASSFGVDVFAPGAANATTNPNSQGLLGRFVRLRAVSATVGFIMGPTQASVSGANAPVLTATGVNAVGGCDQLSPGEWIDLSISVSTRWIGFVGSAAGTLILRPSSTGGDGGG